MSLQGGGTQLQVLGSHRGRSCCCVKLHVMSVRYVPLAQRCRKNQRTRPCICSCAQGQTIQITFTQRTPHYGRFELRVCPLSDPSLLTEYDELSEDCLDAHQLYLAPNSTQVNRNSRPAQSY